MSEMRFEGRVAIVTGAGSGFGRRHAQRLAGRGGTVVVNDAEPADASGGGQARSKSATESRWPTATRLTPAEVRKRWSTPRWTAFGGIDILLLRRATAADAGSTAALLADEDPELLAGLFEGYWVIRAAWVPMRERRYGRIVLYLSARPARCRRHGTGEHRLQHGTGGLMNILKCEGPDHDLMVNMVAPTPDGDDAAIGNLAVYLAHEACRTTGEIFTVGNDGLARMFMGVNEGFFDPGLTTEGVRDRLAEILDPDTFIVPDEAGQEIQQLLLPHLR